MKIWYEFDTFDTVGYGVIRYYGRTEFSNALMFISKIQVEYNLPKEIIQDGYTLQFEVNDRDTYYQIRKDFYHYL